MRVSRLQHRGVVVDIQDPQFLLAWWNLLAIGMESISGGEHIKNAELGLLSKHGQP